MGRQARLAAGMSAWPRTEVGNPRGAVAPMMGQLRRHGYWLTVALIFFLVALPSYAEIRPFGLPNVSPSRWVRFLLLGMTLMLWFIKPFRSSLTDFSGPEVRRLWRMVAVFFIWYLILTLVVNFSSGFFFHDIKNNILPPWFAFMFAAMYVREEKDFLVLFKFLALAVVVVVATMPIEFVLKRNIFEGFISSEGWNQVGLVDQTRDGIYRVKASFEHPLTCAQFLVTMGGAFLTKGLFNAGRVSKFWVAAGVFAILGVIPTYTRSSMVIAAGVVGFIVVLKLMTWTSKFRNKLTATIIRVQLMWLPFFLVGLAMWVLSLLRGRTSEEAMSSEARLSMLKRGLPAMLENPLIGLGPGEGAKVAGFKGYFGVYFLDNIYLAYALDYGLIYCLLFVAILGFAIWRLWPTYQEFRFPVSNTGIRAGMAMALIGSALMLIVHASPGLNEFLFGLIGASLCLPGRRFNRPFGLASGK